MVWEGVWVAKGMLLRKIDSRFLVVGFVLAAVSISAAQTAGPVSIFTTDVQSLKIREFTFSNIWPPYGVETHQLSSKLMARDMPYRVVLPPNYKSDQATVRYPVVFLLHGLTGHFDNWTDKTKLADYASRYNFIIVTPEGGDGWYTDSATVPNEKYESYIIKELIPEIDSKFRTLADRDHRAIAGLSMGGYGAIKFGLKYPEIFSLAGSFSGALAVTATLPTTRDAGFVKSIHTIFGPADSETRKTNDIFKIVSEMPDASKKNLPFLYIDCGTEDFLFQSNRNFIGLLLEEKIPHEYRQRPGGHTWTYWDAQVQQFLEVSEKHFKK